MNKVYEQGFMDKLAEHGMTKASSPLERKLIKTFLDSGREVPIEVARKATGRWYPKGFRTLNEYLAGRADFFKKEIVPRRKRIIQLGRGAQPLDKLVADMSEPRFRGVTKLPRNHHYFSGTYLPDSVMKKLPSQNPTFIDKIEGRRFFASDPVNASLYTDVRHNGTGEMRVVDLGTFPGRLAKKLGIVVETPYLDAPSTRFRRAVNRMIRKGEIVPARDLSYPSGAHLNPAALNNKTTIPKWLRPFLKEREYTVVRRKLPTSGSSPVIDVLPREQGREFRRLNDELAQIVSNDEKFIGDAYRIKPHF